MTHHVCQIELRRLLHHEKVLVGFISIALVIQYVKGGFVVQGLCRRGLCPLRWLGVQRELFPEKVQTLGVPVLGFGKHAVEWPLPLSLVPLSV